MNVDLSGNKAHEAVLGRLLVSVYKLTAAQHRSKPCTAVTQGDVTDHFELLWRGWFQGGGVIPTDISVHG